MAKAGTCVATVGWRIATVGIRVGTLGRRVPTIGSCVPTLGACVATIGTHVSTVGTRVAMTDTHVPTFATHRESFRPHGKIRGEGASGRLRAVPPVPRRAADCAPDRANSVPTVPAALPAGTGPLIHPASAPLHPPETVAAAVSAAIRALMHATRVPLQLRLELIHAQDIDELMIVLLPVPPTASGRPVIDPELWKNILEMFVNRARTGLENFGDLLAGFAVRNPIQHLALARRQARPRHSVFPVAVAFARLLLRDR